MNASPGPAVATVAEIWRFPVKSMGGERLGSARVTERGIPGDRAFGVIDARSGKVLSAKTVPALLQVSARWEERGEVRFAGGPLDGVGSDDADVDARLSSWLGRPVHLRAARAGERTPFDLPDDPDAPSEIREVETPAGSFFDSRSTLHVLSDASLRGARTLHPAGDWHPARFRPNLLVHVPGAGFPEEAWVGCRLRVGSVGASVRKASARCVLVVQAQPGLERDATVFRVLARERAGNLGIYVDPEGPGEVRTGDRLEVVA